MGVISSSVITGDDLQHDLLVSISNEFLYKLELTIGLQSKLRNNAERQQQWALVFEQNMQYKEAKSKSFYECFRHIRLYATYFLEMLTNVQFNNKSKNYIIKKESTIAIRSSYYIFCTCNKELSNTELMTF